MARSTKDREIQVQKPAQSLAHFQTKLGTGQEEDGGLIKPILLGVAAVVAVGMVVGGWSAWQSSAAEKHEGALSTLQLEVEGDGIAPLPAAEVERRMRERLGRLEALVAAAPSSRRAATAGLLATWRLTLDMNVVHSNVAGARADVPLKLRVDTSVGGSVERENRRETISPYRRDARDLYVQTEDPFFGLGNIRVSARRSRVEYENGVQNVNLQGYDLRYWARFRPGVDVSANLSHETDTGGVVPRQRTITSAKAQWRYRKLNLTFDLGRTLETQGEATRSRALVQIMARREF